jgi:hypothetical protein
VHRDTGGRDGRVKVREAAGLPPPLNRHLVFAGNPGTGKTPWPGCTAGSCTCSACSPAAISSRFTRTLTFDDYGSEELVRIVQYHAGRHEYECHRTPSKNCVNSSKTCPEGAVRKRPHRPADLPADDGTDAQRMPEDLAAIGPGDLTTLLPDDLPPPEAV